MIAAAALGDAETGSSEVVVSGFVLIGIAGLSCSAASSDSATAANDKTASL